MTKPIRCAIYTRKSTDHGLELEFNSLDAQREACEAFIKSQIALGWKCSEVRYDDPAFSGASLGRPALQRLLADIEAGEVDVIVVYKIDRLTRSLADFAKLVEIFDAKSISFVAVTQQFNTTTSMGRLTLNVLLSFAQFERELSSERVRDKIAASRAKGKWTGGTIPLGYVAKDKKLVPDPAEQKIVRFIFEQFLKIGSVAGLIAELDRRKIVTKRRKAKTKSACGGFPFRYGTLAHLLGNRIYLGEVRHGNHWYRAEHEAILSRNLFDRVQSLKSQKRTESDREARPTNALLQGLVYDDRGHRMIPNFTVKKGVRYYFYVSLPILKGRKGEAGTIGRVSARKLEAAVTGVLKQQSQSLTAINRQNIDQLVERIEVAKDGVRLFLKMDGVAKTVAVPLEKDMGQKSSGVSPTGTEQLKSSLVRAHHWLGQLTKGKFRSVEDFAATFGFNPEFVRSELKLAFLSPEVTRAILRGKPVVDPRRAGSPLPLTWGSQNSALLKADDRRAQVGGSR